MEMGFVTHPLLPKDNLRNVDLFLKMGDYRNRKIENKYIFKKIKRVYSGIG